MKKVEAQDNTQKSTYYLEMAHRKDLKPSQRPSLAFDLKRVEIPCPEFNWFLHQAVGVEFRWGGRSDWGRQEWTAYVDRPELETWVVYVAGTPAGYYELQLEEDGSVQIVCFGLRRQFFGQGLGGTLLAFAVERSWEMGAPRVWLKTCSHDHEHAIRNYLARGFKLVEEKKTPANSLQTSELFGGRDP